MCSDFSQQPSMGAWKDCLLCHSVLSACLPTSSTECLCCYSNTISSFFVFPGICPTVLATAKRQKRDYCTFKQTIFNLQYFLILYVLQTIKKMYTIKFKESIKHQTKMERINFRTPSGTMSRSLFARSFVASNYALNSPILRIQNCWH